MNVGNILKEYLETNGYDGIYNPCEECACLPNDLAPCGSLQPECRPGHFDPTYEKECERDFRIVGD